jgi:nucleoside-diphosphate-sugar epimerase
MTPLAPTTVYGASKAALSLMAPAFAAQYGVESTAWARLFYLYGPREQPTRLVPSAIRALGVGDELRSSHGQQVRDVLYVQDAADALSALLDADAIGAVNIGSGRGVTLQKILSEIGGQLGGEELIRFGARPADPDDPPFLVADTTRLTCEVGWAPATSLEEGIRRSIAWWQDRYDHGRRGSCGHESRSRGAPREGAAHG